jgi:pSer/pThr/pTyr-binding forkhead associated (FHA) protein
LIVQCSECQKRYKLEDAHFRGGDTYEFRCTSCGASVTARREPPPEEAPRPSTQKIPKVNATATGSDCPDSHLLQMPPGKHISLAVLQGPDQGTIHPITKTVVVIGRAEADIVLNDTEVSRRHAQLEVKGSAVVLRDLKSTNGTYLNEQHVTASELEANAEFRVGGTTFMLIMTEELD